MDREAWRAVIHGVAKSPTWLSDLSDLIWYNAITSHLEDLRSWLEIKPWNFGVVALTPTHWTTRELTISSFSGSVVTICKPIECSMPDLPFHHQLLKFMQIHVHWVGDDIQPSHFLSSPSPTAFNLSQHQGLIKWFSSLHQVAEVLEFQLQQQSFQRIVRIDLV